MQNDKGLSKADKWKDLPCALKINRDSIASFEIYLKNSDESFDMLMSCMYLIDSSIEIISIVTVFKPLIATGPILALYFGIVQRA